MAQSSMFVQPRIGNDTILSKIKELMNLLIEIKKGSKQLSPENYFSIATNHFIFKQATPAKFKDYCEKLFSLRHKYPENSNDFNNVNNLLNDLIKKCPEQWEYLNNSLQQEDSEQQFSAASPAA